MVFHWNRRKSKSAQVSRAILCILTKISNTLVWMVLVDPLIFKSSSPFTTLLEVVPGAPIINGITVTKKSMEHDVPYFLVLYQGIDIDPAFHFLLL